MEDLPVIDVAPLRAGPGVSEDSVAEVAVDIDAACRRHGFFLVTGHGVDPALFERLRSASRGFFARPESEKDRVAMARAGRAWRGWFPLGAELTSGVPDGKEGIYFGAEHPADHPGVRAGLPLHGPNLFPDQPSELRPTVLAWMDVMSALAQDLMGGVALGLGLERNWFHSHLTADPTILLRIFRYPPEPEPSPDRWGVAEHTDYGLLTILAQEKGGLEVHTRGGWIDVPMVEGTFVCNLGDMLERMTAGRYRSTPHRVKATPEDRLSFPFFFDPGWDAEVGALPVDDQEPPDRAHPRWDAADVHAFEGPYHRYLLDKVAKVFPDLADGHGH